MQKGELSVAEVAGFAGVHRNTVLRYERIGMIESSRDRNNYRRYPLEEALKLKRLINLRVSRQNED